MFERYGWLVVLDDLTGGDDTKREHFERMNVIPFLNLLTYRIDKREEENRQIEFQKLRMRL